MKVMCTDRHSFNGLFSRTTRVNWYQKVTSFKTSKRCVMG